MGVGEEGSWELGVGGWGRRELGVRSWGKRGVGSWEKKKQENLITINSAHCFAEEPRNSTLFPPPPHLPTLFSLSTQHSALSTLFPHLPIPPPSSHSEL
uniref:Uncharacterized protein n=1 Tax=Desertifilum tharense IPPAS B-1220 TaxID=1781255 RepID=A0ACD5GTC4_9CYAN